MKFKTGFVLGAAAGAWAVSKASQLQRDRRPGQAEPSSDDTVERLRALGGLVRERVSGLVDGPLGEIAKERLAEVLDMAMSGDRAVNGNRREDAIDTTAR